jgi:Glycosyltransferase
MKILLIHNNYGVYSGEETVVDRQMALFKEMGYEVTIYRKTTEGVRGTAWGSLKGLLFGFYAPNAVRDIKRLIKNDKPDVVVVHNLYPFISPAVLKPIKQAGIPIIMTIHNFRLICPTGLFMRNAAPCEDCLEKRSEWSCIRHNCEHSLMKSIGYAGRNWFARITQAYKDSVDYFACITQFQIQKLIAAEFDPEKMKHIPNFLENISEPKYTRGDYVAICGRLSKEKGIDLILEIARQTPNIPFVFAGTVRPEDAELIKNAPVNCTFVGHLAAEKLKDFYSKARFLLMGSRCYEGFPMTILEAANFGKTSIGPAHGGFPEIIDDNSTGLLFAPGNAEDLKEKIISLWNDPEKTVEYGKNAYQKLKKNYTMEVVRKKWSDLLANYQEK